MADTKKLGLIRQLIEAAEQSLARAQSLLEDTPIQKAAGNADILERAKAVGKISVEDKTKIIEGIFDGQNMISPDGKQYSVPANYASKSKLVEGDRLKLTIMPDGSFVYKQIGPVERVRLIGSLIRDEATNEYLVLSADRTFRVLLASVTYFKGEVGDEVVVLVPKTQSGEWAAVENVIKKIETDEPAAGPGRKTKAKDLDDLE